MVSQNCRSVQPRQGWPAPIGQLVPLFHWKIGQGEKVAGPLQPTVIEAPPLAGGSSSNVVNELAGVEVGAPRALIVDARAVREERTSLGDPAGGQLGRT